MTATPGEPRAKRCKGFTIESIIGKDSDRQTETRTEVTESRLHSQSTSHASETDTHRGYLESEKNDRLRPKDAEIRATNVDIQKTNVVIHTTNGDIHRTHGLNIHRHHIPSHRDTSAIRDSSFNNVRDIRTITPPESLKPFHEAFMHSTNCNTNVGLGHFGQQGLMRHPLSPLNMPMYPQHVSPTTQLPPMLMNGARDLRQMYPYLAERYPGYVLPRFGVGSPGLFFQPYRKPKRIRTAFSPTQLLQLEKSFEKSHYVVGQERKDLASELQLSETQVKVWFQNRRTKHKRTKSEEDGLTPMSQDGGQDMTSMHYEHSNDESDLSDIDDMDEVHVGDPRDTYHAHAYQQHHQQQSLVSC